MQSKCPLKCRNTIRGDQHERLVRAQTGECWNKSQVSKVLWLVFKNQLGLNHAYGSTGEYLTSDEACSSPETLSLLIHHSWNLDKDTVSVSITLAAVPVKCFRSSFTALFGLLVKSKRVHRWHVWPQTLLILPCRKTWGRICERFKPKQDPDPRTWPETAQLILRKLAEIKNGKGLESKSRCTSSCWHIPRWFDLFYVCCLLMFSRYFLIVS